MSTDSAPEPREMNAAELLRWSWRQLASMRTALVLLLLLALASIPGSLIPQNGVDPSKVGDFRDVHPSLTKLYDRLDLFNVYQSAWFAAIYILLVISLVGCIVPRLGVYCRAFRAQPPAVPADLTRMPVSRVIGPSGEPADVSSESEGPITRLTDTLKKSGYRIRKGTAPNELSAEKGYLREAGNLLFHFSIIIVLIGFATGSLFGYKGGVVVLVGKDYGFANELTQYDDFVAGSLFSPRQLNKFSFSIDSFDVSWLKRDNGTEQAGEFQSHLSYDGGSGETQQYDLRVNHPLSIGATDIFLIAHGYAPLITVTDGEGDVTYSGPTVFLPQGQTFVSTGVVKAPYAEPEQLGLNAVFYPSEVTVDGEPLNLSGDAGDGSQAMLSFVAWKGDLGLTQGAQSVYSLDTTAMTQVTAEGGKAFNLRLGETATLPDGLGTVSFDGIAQWNKLQISQHPWQGVALVGMVLALLGLLGSLYLRPRRVFARLRTTEEGDELHLAVLERSSGADPESVLDQLAARLSR